MTSSWLIDTTIKQSRYSASDFEDTLRPLFRTSGREFKTEKKVVTALGVTQKIYDPLVEFLWRPKWKPAKRPHGWEPTHDKQHHFHHSIVDSLTSVVFEDLDHPEECIAELSAAYCTHESSARPATSHNIVGGRCGDMHSWVL